MTPKPTAQKCNLTGELIIPNAFKVIIHIFKICFRYKNFMLNIIQPFDSYNLILACSMDMMSDPETCEIQRCVLPEEWTNVFACWFFYILLLRHEILHFEKIYSSPIFWICTWYFSPDVRRVPYSYLFCSKLATHLLTPNSYHLSWKYIRVLVAKQIFSKRWIKAYGEEKPTKFSLPI